VIFAPKSGLVQGKREVMFTCWGGGKSYLLLGSPITLGPGKRAGKREKNSGMLHEGGLYGNVASCEGPTRDRVTGRRGGLLLCTSLWSHRRTDKRRESGYSSVMEKNLCFAQRKEKKRGRCVNHGLGERLLFALKEHGCFLMKEGGEKN